MSKQDFTEGQRKYLANPTIATDMVDTLANVRDIMSVIHTTIAGPNFARGRVEFDQSTREGLMIMLSWSSAALDAGIRNTNK